jgi:hypothetical protein
MYSGEYDACDVTLSVYPYRTSLKNMSKKRFKTFIITQYQGCKWNNRLHCLLRLFPHVSRGKDRFVIGLKIKA